LNTIVFDEQTVVIPGWVTDHASFRRWAHSDDFPETGSVGFLQGGVWIDMSKEQIFSHNQVKHEFAYTLTGIIRSHRVPKIRDGRYFPDGVLLSNEDAELTTQPDGVFVAADSFDSGRVRLVEGVGGGFVELEGSPDMTLEVVSRGSVEKDTVTLIEQYWLAKVQEYWLVDVRGDRLLFNMYRYGPRGYVPVKKQAGWLRSNLLGKSFRLSRSTDKQGHPVFTLHVKD
jgi:Uma2 family endonuclease